MTHLFGKMILGVRTIFEQAKARCKAIQIATLSKLHVDFQTLIDKLGRWVTSRYVDIGAPDLIQMRDDFDILRAGVCFLAESFVATVHSIIPSVVQISALQLLRYFDFFVEIDEEVPTVGNNRGHLNDLQDPNMTEEDFIKKAMHYYLETAFIDRQCRIAIIEGASSSSALPTPLPL